MSFGLFFSSSSSSSASVITTKGDTSTNSQRIGVLSAKHYGIETPGAVGGPNDITVDNRFATLVPSQGLHTGESESIRSTQIDPSGIIIYVVQEGDTLSEIAERFDVSINTIKWENNLSSDKIVLGQELRILPMTGVRHTIISGNSISKIAKEYGVDQLDVAVFNFKHIEEKYNEVEKRNGNIQEVYDEIEKIKLVVGEKILIPNGIKKAAVAVTATSSSTSSSSSTPTPSSSSSSTADTGYYIKPTAGSMTSLFGPRWGRYHYGVDYAGRPGTPIVATASGVVSRIGCGSGYGNCLIIEHDNGTESLYAHIRNGGIHVRVGQTVNQGQHIADIGATGNVTGPHLHFEVIDSNTGQKKNMNYLK